MSSALSGQSPALDKEKPSDIRIAKISAPPFNDGLYRFAFSTFVIGSEAGAYERNWTERLFLPDEAAQHDITLLALEGIRAVSNSAERIEPGEIDEFLGDQVLPKLVEIKQSMTK